MSQSPWKSTERAGLHQYAKMPWLRCHKLMPEALPLWAICVRIVTAAVSLSQHRTKHTTGFDSSDILMTPTRPAFNGKTATQKGKWEVRGIAEALSCVFLPAFLSVVLSVTPRPWATYPEAIQEKVPQHRFKGLPGGGGMKGFKVEAAKGSATTAGGSPGWVVLSLMAV